MRPSRMDRLDFVSSIVLTAFGIGAIVESLRLPRLEHLDINPYTVPGLLPGILGVALTLCGGFVLIRSIRRGGWRLGLDGGSLAALLASPTARRSGLSLGLCLVYALGLFGVLPFWLATALFVFVFVVATEHMAQLTPSVIRLAGALALALATGLAVQLLFEEVFLVRLP